MKKISIVVCTHDGAPRIQSCLEAIISQPEREFWELVVVDNNSSDGTGDLCRQYLEKNFEKNAWKVIHESNPGLVFARIAGLRASLFEWVLFCDDDNLLSPDFISICFSNLGGKNEVGVIGSHGIPKFLSEKPHWFDQYSSSFAVGSQLKFGFRKERLNSVYGACSVFRKQPLLDLFDRGFNPLMTGRKDGTMTSGEDVEWCWLLQLLGYRIEYVPDLKFYHQLSENRFTWEYYISLKQGISSSVALLFSYRLFFSNQKKSRRRFWFAYKLEHLKALILYEKYNWKWSGNPTNPKDKLAFAILEARKNSFRNYFELSLNHFLQLKRFF